MIEKLAARCRGSFSRDAVITETGALADYERNLSEFVRSVPLAIRPKSTAEVTNVISWARELRVPLFPVSHGKNWGLGSKAPGRSGSVVVDLSGMTAIRELDLEMGCALIEPGVTQAQLAEALQGSPYFLDVTGSGRDTSVVGNALDRGVAYHSLRCETVFPQEIVLGNGEVLLTGHAHFKNARTRLFCRAGAGPSLDGLFFQSGFGVVTAAVVQFKRRPAWQESYNVFLEDESRLPALIEKLRDLKQRGLVQGIPHVFNRERLVPAVAALVRLEGRKDGRVLNRPSTEAIVNRRLPGAWIAGGHLGGERPVVKAAKKTLVAELRAFGRIDFMSTGKLRWIETALNMFNRRDDLLLLNAFKAVRGFSTGEPTDAALYSTCWPITETVENQNVKDLDRCLAGFLYCVPVIPARAADVSEGLAEIAAVSAKFGFAPATSLNLASDHFLETVVSVSFARSDETLVRQAHEWRHELTERLLHKGFPPYRLDIEGQKWITNEDDSYWRCIRDLKSAVDPAGIIAPGRYCPTS